MTSQPSILLFDVMDTLVYDPFREMPEFFGLSWSELAAARGPQGWLDFERARIDETTFLRTFFSDERSFDHDGFLDLFRQGYRWLPGMEELLSELQAGGQEMHVLSNYPLWYLRIEEKLQVSRYLPWTFVSCHTGVRKPDPEAFRGAARALHRQPEHCLFIDNNRSNCDGARAVGMDALLFEGAPALRAKLSALGLM